jgi:hypothetical protein
MKHSDHDAEAGTIIALTNNILNSWSDVCHAIDGDFNFSRYDVDNRVINYLLTLL